MKTVSIFLALVNSIFAGFLIVLDLSSHGVDQSILWWMLIKLSAASLDEKMSITRSYEHEPAPQLFAPFSFLYLRSTYPVQSLREGFGKSGRHVLYQNHPRQIGFQIL